MKLSIITICYNNYEGLKRTIESVRSQTAQKGVDYEYLIIDGGSTDGSVELIKSYAVDIDYYVSERDNGIYDAMNKGIVIAQGEYLNFMNAGDTFANAEVVKRVIPHLQGKDYYIGHQRNLPPHSLTVKAPKDVLVRKLLQNALPHQATFIRAMLLKERPYDCSYAILADWKQMIEELILNNASYERLDFLVTHFDTTGISSSSQSKYKEEHQRLIKELFPPRISRVLVGDDNFSRKVLYALDKSNHISRDLKILRNSLKALPRDIWKSFMRK